MLYLREVEIIQEVHEPAVARWTKVCPGFLLQGQSHRVLLRRDEANTEQRLVSVKESLYKNPPASPYTRGTDDSCKLVPGRHSFKTPDSSLTKS